MLDDERLARFRTIVGADRWAHDQDGWRLVGINAMLLGTGHPDERAQDEWLAGAFDSAKPIALFLHKPLFVDDPLEGPHGYWTVIPEARRRVLALMAGADVRLIASGHLHVARTKSFGTASHVWGPSSAFVCGPSQTDVPGERRIGIVSHDFDASGVTSRTIILDDADHLEIDPHLHEIYPAPAALEAARG